MESFTMLRIAVCGKYIYVGIYISLSPEFRRAFL